MTVFGTIVWAFLLGGLAFLIWDAITDLMEQMR